MSHRKQCRDQESSLFLLIKVKTFLNTYSKDDSSIFCYLVHFFSDMSLLHYAQGSFVTSSCYNQCFSIERLTWRIEYTLLVCSCAQIDLKLVLFWEIVVHCLSYCVKNKRRSLSLLHWGMFTSVFAWAECLVQVWMKNNVRRSRL